MRGIALGRLIEYERQKAKIDIEKLIDGLCSKTILKKIETGERLFDFFLIERIIERLGLSINKLDVLLDESSYEIVLKRERIETLIDREQFAEAKAELLLYEKAFKEGDFLQEQYTKKMRGVLASLCGDNPNVVMGYFLEALLITVKGFSIDRLSDYILGEEEIIILFMYLRERENVSRFRISDYCDTILDYIETNFRDETVRVHLYTGAALLIGESFMACEKYEEALRITLKAEQLIAENGLLTHLLSVLDRIIIVSKRIDKAVYRKYSKMRAAFLAAFCVYGLELIKEPKFWKSNKTNEIYLISEILREERFILGISQEDLASDIGIDAKTISRLESGKARPKPATLKKIREYFGVNRCIPEARIVTRDFELIEMDREISRLLVFHQSEAANVLFQRLKVRLPKEHMENRQYIAFMDLIFDKRRGEKSDRELLSELEEAFFIGRGKEGLLRLGDYIPNMTETMIINNMALCYRRMGRIGEGVSLLEKAIAGYENSRVSRRRNYASLSVLYANLAIFYEESRRFKEGIEISDKAIVYALSCYRGEHLAELLQEKTYTLDRMRGYRLETKETYRQIYQVMRLTRVSSEKKAVLASAFLKWYGEDIE